MEWGPGLKVKMPAFCIGVHDSQLWLLTSASLLIQTLGGRRDGSNIQVLAISVEDLYGVPGSQLQCWPLWVFEEWPSGWDPIANKYIKLKQNLLFLIPHCKTVMHILTSITTHLLGPVLAIKLLVSTVTQILWVRPGSGSCVGRVIIFLKGLT